MAKAAKSAHAANSATSASSGRPVCVIVGMGPGVSLSLARLFGEKGYLIAMLARRKEPLKKLQALLDRDEIEAHVFTADAGDFPSVAKAFAGVHRSLGPTEVLIYNVAVGAPGLPSRKPADELVADFRVNVAGALVAAQQAVPVMKKRKKGTLLFTGGGLALEPLPTLASLAIGKAGMRSLALSLAGELEPAGIRVATVTIAGIVKAGTAFDPDRIAEEYWKLHQAAPGKGAREIVYRG